MTKDSTINNFTAVKSQMKTPKKSSVEFIRQFSRTYAMVASGMAIICN